MWGTTPAPPMDAIQGYETMARNSSMIPPPPPPPPEEQRSLVQASRKLSFSNYPRLTEEKAKQALIDFAASHCCYGKQAARDMVIDNIEFSTTAQYTLHTFGEKRQFFWQFETYTGQAIDSSWDNIPPGPWEIVIPPPMNFKETIAKAEVPHTASVKPCIECLASGNQRCPICFGFGQIICTFCSGMGHDIFETCSFCHGTGTTRCVECAGSGQIACRKCNGTKHLKCFIQLTCYWNNHIDDVTVDSTFLPKGLLKGLIGQVIFEEDVPRVSPIENFPDNAVNEVSTRLIIQHRSYFKTEKIIRQRHRIRVIPIAKVNYVWKGSTDHYFVLGFENKVHAPNYPQKYCWGCSIV